MQMFEIRRYRPEDQRLWDNYVAKARNATFLFYRGYMNYHSDRFEDHSLLFFIGNHLHSILPANIAGTTLYSHQGLTYGGLLMDVDVTAAEVIQLFQELNVYLHQQGIRKVVYKPVPWVYHQLPSEEDLYPLYWVCKAQITQRDIGTVIFLQKNLRWRKDWNRTSWSGIRCTLSTLWKKSNCCMHVSLKILSNTMPCSTAKWWLA